MKKILTYGTYDLLHMGHINLLARAKALGDYLIVGLSTDEFNNMKHKDAFMPFMQRKAVLEAIRFVDLVIPEDRWEQKKEDVKAHDIDVLVMGDDWAGKFDELMTLCDVVYLPRTENISTTILKQDVIGRLARKK